MTIKTGNDETALSCREPVPPASEERQECGRYALTQSGFELSIAAEKGWIWVPLTSFTARIARNVVEERNGEQYNRLFIEARLNANRITFELEGSEFLRMHWPIERLGATAVIHPLGFNQNQHVATSSRTRRPTPSWTGCTRDLTNR